MIIGRGMLAQAFSTYKNDNKVVIFASGVSNSLETKEEVYLREVDLVEKTIRENTDKLFVYFSTCSMYDPIAKNSLYVRHKLKLEQLISMKSNNFLILRISQVLGISKNSTLTNFLFEHINQQKQFNLWRNSNRNLISLPDVIDISQKIIQQGDNYNKTFHIANRVYIDMVDLVGLIENVLGKKGVYKLIDKGEKYEDIPNDIDKFVESLHISFDAHYYLKNLLIYYNSYSNKLISVIDG